LLIDCQHLENLLNRLQELRGREGHNIESTFLDGLVTLLRETNFPIDYNYKLDRIAILNKIDVSTGRIKMVSIDDRRSWIENEPLHLVNHKIIGVFPQGENAIYSEYEELIKKARYNEGEELAPIKELLQGYDVSTANDEETSTTNTDQDKEYESIKLDDIPTEKLNLAVPSDASQDTVVLASQSANFIVVRGPPGTGKSQVIVNLISNALSKRQKILLVCDKEQALGVVYQRLEKLGLSRFVAFLSDPQNRPALYNKLGRILESEVISDNLNLINQRFNYYSHEIDRITEKQNKIINALKEQETFGISISKLYMLAKPDYVPKLDLLWIGSELKYHALTRTLDNIQELEDRCKRFDSLESPWIHRKEFSNLDFSDKFNIQKIIDNILDPSKQKNAIFLASSDYQKTLINALDGLSKNSGGFFHKFLGGGKERVSNHTFYNKRLKIAPNIQRNATPIKWISCNNGEWIRGRNRPEAIRVVKELKNILMKSKIDGINRSIGIITFNLPQKEEIEEEIFRRTQIDREFKDLYYAADNEKNSKSELPFVRNVERVQGEERDIIIFSLGYAEELMSPEDTITIQFGSLNQRNGEKYLNVAITRARQEVIIVCSFDPFRIDAENAEYEGPKRLKDYLCYAKSLSDSNTLQAKDALSSPPWLSSSALDMGRNDEYEESDFSDYTLQKAVQNELEKMGYRVDLQVGHSKYKIDIAVVHPDLPSRYILAIECDGKSFLYAPSTKERDITRQEFLENKGWTVERIWSRNWWRESRKEIDRIHRRIQELRRRKIPDDLIGGDFLVQQSPSADKLYEDLIKKGESDSLEFKGSLVWDYKLSKPNKSLWHPILKTVAAFMNS
jgi:very-short-patch-repair endonuclease